MRWEVLKRAHFPYVYLARIYLEFVFIPVPRCRSGDVWIWGLGIVIHAQPRLGIPRSTGSWALDLIFVIDVESSPRNRPATELLLRYISRSLRVLKLRLK